MNRFLLIAFIVSFTVVANGQSPSQPAVRGQIGNDVMSGSDARVDGRILHVRDLTMMFDGRQLRADEASYNMATSQLELRGNVTLTLPDGPWGFYKVGPR